MADFRKKIWLRIGITTVFFIAVLGTTFFFGSRLSSYAATIQSMKREIANRNFAIQSLAALQGEANEAQKYDSTLEHILPTQDELILTFRKDIGVLSRADNLQFSFTFGELQPGDAQTPGFINFTMSETGSLESITHFLRSLEISRYFIGVTSFDIVATGKVWKLSFMGKVFSKPILQN